jgi:predicted exporter
MARNRIDTDLVNLLPRDAEAAAGFARYAELFGRDDTIVGLIEGEHALEQADQIASMKNIDDVTLTVRDRLGPSALEYLRRHALVLLDDDGVAELERRAGDPRVARRLRAALNSPAGSVASEQLLEDPLGVLEILGRRFPSTNQIDTQSGRFATPDGRAALVLVQAKPVRPWLAKRLRELAPDVGWTGAPIYAAVYEAAVKRDLLVSSLASLAAILLLFGAFFRSLRILPIVAIALALSYVLTLGLWGAIVGRIGAISLAFGGILLGIGVDVPIQLWSRLREELATHPPLEALSRTLRALAGVSIVATLGPALVFGACALARFRGLAQLGGLAALGLCTNVAVMLIVLPALLALTPRLWGGVPTQARGEGWLEKIGAACARRHRLVLVTAGLVVGISCWFFHPRLASHPLAFEQTMEPSRVEERIEQLFGRRRGRLIALSEAATLDEALAKNDRVTAMLRSMVPTGVQSLTDLLPSPATQTQRSARIRRSAIETNLRKNLDDAGLRAEAFESFFAQLRDPPPATREELEGSDLAPIVRSELSGTSVAAYALPASSEQVPQLANEALLAGATATGAPLVEADIARALPRDLLRTSLISVAAVALLLLAYYRRLRPTLYVLAPLAVAWAAFLSLAPPLSVFTLIAVPLVIGYGIDDHVFLVGRALEGQALSAPRRAVVLTTLATLAGFLSLLLASFSGIRALGAAGALAVVLCFAAAMIVLPAMRPRAGKREARARGSAEA